MGKKHFKGVLLVLMVLTMALIAVGTASASTSEEVLLLKAVGAWGTNSDEAVLSNLGYDYTVSDISELDNIKLSDYKMVVIANDQTQSFYNNYSLFQDEISSYVKSGGVLVFGAADQGWGGGELTADLPGGVESIHQYDSYNYIADDSNPIVTGELTDNQTLTNSDLVGTYCSHNYFLESSLPSDATIILRGSSTDGPTLVMYELKKGNVVASGLVWDLYYYSGSYPFAGKAFDDLFAYAMSLGGNVSSGHDSLPGHTTFASHTSFEH